MTQADATIQADALERQNETMGVPPVEGLMIVRVEPAPRCDVGCKLVFDDGSSLAFGFGYMYGDVTYVDPDGHEFDYTESLLESCK